jgi:hypothetical protein
LELQAASCKPQAKSRRCAARTFLRLEACSV